MDEWTDLQYVDAMPGITACQVMAMLTCYIGPKYGQGQKCSRHDILKSLDKLTSRGIHVGSIVLDDTWQTIEQDQPSRYHAGLLGFEADSTNFKNGLKNAISEIEHSVRNVIVRHPIFGYWGGIADNSETPIEKSYETIRVQRSEKAVPEGLSPVLQSSIVAPTDVQRWYDDYYR